MRIDRFACLILPLLALPWAPAVLAGNGHGTAPSTPANALVGSWSVRGTVGPCDGSGPPPRVLLATVAFHAGGTTTETNTFPISGVPSPWGLSARNGPGLGTWHYEPRHRRHLVQFRFDWFVDGVYHGYQQIQRQEIFMAADGQTYASTVRAARFQYDPATDTHFKIADFCGETFGERI